MRDNSNNLLGSFPFQVRALGGGGFTFRPKFSDDGTMVVSTDTDQGLFRAPGATVWTEMLRMGVNITYGTDLDYGYYGGGTLDAAVHKTNSQRMATYFGGYLWLTTNRFSTVTKANLAQANVGGNGVGTPASRIEFDSGENVLIYCDPTTGIRYTTNGGTSFTTVASVPNGGYATYIAIDRSSSVSSSKHQIVYAFSNGNGVYRSTTGISGTFSHIASSPNDLMDIKCGPTGILWCTNVAGDALKWTSGGGWVTITGSNGAYTAVPDLTDEDICYFVTQGGALQATTDGAAIDRYGPGDTSGTRVASDIPWLAWTDEDYMSNGGGAFDPLDETRLVVAEGIGVWETLEPLPDTGENDGPTWTSLTEGIDQLCVMEHKVTPNGKLLVSVLDRALFVLDIAEPSRYPTRHGPIATSITHSQCIDWAGDDPDFFVGVSHTAPYCHYYDGTWHSDVATVGASASGNIAASTKLNWVWAQTNNGAVSYTTNGGGSWGTCQFGGSALTGVTTINSYNHQRQILVADKDNPGHFYMFVVGNGTGDANDLAFKGLWKSTNGGAAWTRIKSSLITSFGRDFWNCKLRIYSRGAGNDPDLFWAVGDEAGAGEDSVSTGALLYSRGGASWATVPLCDEIHDLAIGKAVLDHNYPCLYLNGWVSGVLGFYWCPDFDPATRTGTWEQPGSRFPMGSTDTGWTVSADMNSHRVTIGHGGSGLIAGGHRWSIKAKAPSGGSAGQSVGLFPLLPLTKAA